MHYSSLPPASKASIGFIFFCLEKNITVRYLSNKGLLIVDTPPCRLPESEFLLRSVLKSTSAELDFHQPRARCFLPLSKLSCFQQPSQVLKKFGFLFCRHRNVCFRFPLDVFFLRGSRRRENVVDGIPKFSNFLKLFFFSFNFPAGYVEISRWKILTSANKGASVSLRRG